MSIGQPIGIPIDRVTRRQPTSLKVKFINRLPVASSFVVVIAWAAIRFIICVRNSAYNSFNFINRVGNPFNILHFYVRTNVKNSTSSLCGVVCPFCFIYIIRNNIFKYHLWNYDIFRKILKLDVVECKCRSWTKF